MQDNRSALERMTALLAQWEGAGDHRAIFLGCYSLMTRNMLAALDAGRFHDGQWVQALLEHFASYYFNALGAYEAGDPAVPVVWRQAHAAAGQPHTLAIQNLLLGVNAHVNYDLVFAVVDLLAPEWAGLAEPEREARYHDFCLVNHVIAETVDAVQDQVLERYSLAMEVVDRLMGPVDEWIAAHLIAQWRDEVWQNALAWLAAADADQHAALRRQVEAVALRWAGRLDRGAAAAGHTGV